jgi:xylan 1,4-beta-xylosidase
MSSRRDILTGGFAGAVGLSSMPLLDPPRAAAAASKAVGPTWRRGSEQQRLADLGDGTYLNPVLAGDYADPTVLRDGDEYFMTNTSHDATPGIVLWRSPDLVNWSPIGPILRNSIGTVWAMDLIKHRNRYFLYIPAFFGGRQTIMVMHSDRIDSGWSDPIDLGVSRIDPGHVVGEDGKRYLFFNGGTRVRLSDDGLALDGPLVEGAYDLWRYPEHWVVEMYAPEGPKFFWKDGWLYLVAAVGGTAGPPTSHMVVVARSRSVFGPWEQCPHNPIVRTRSAAEPWWSRGHATLIEDPTHQWWMVYHGYENGYRTLGRQVLLEPATWDDKEWPHAQGGDLSRPLPRPKGAKATKAASREHTLSDDFSQDRFGTLWRFHKPGPTELSRVARAGGLMTLAAKGTSPADCSPLTMNPTDRAYEVEVTVEPHGGAEGGLLLFYNERGHVGCGFDGTRISSYVYGERHDWLNIELKVPRVTFRLTNDHQIVTMHYRSGDGPWIKHPWQLEVSGIHQNVLGSFLSLRPSLFACRQGEARFRAFRYGGLP